MRLHFELSRNREAVAFNYQHRLIQTFHAWIGQNELHDAMSLYSLGWLQGGKARGKALYFPMGARWFISAPDTESGQTLIERVRGGALESPCVGWGMNVVNTTLEETPDFGTQHRFFADSPIFIKDSHDKHILYDDPRADEHLTYSLRNKLKKAGLEHLSEGASVAFDKNFKTPKTRLIHIKDGFCKKASVCPVIVNGTSQAVGFAWSVGAGHMTGSCFGSLRG